MILIARPVSGQPEAYDEAGRCSLGRPGDLQTLDIHPTQWRQLNDYQERSYPHID
ncbi:hypothetical protein [Nonomuraea sp. B19D2]|uniref:hypothetical protein n=1 Tax=Nonomuraea sp. B19D2 TaxID=3159561 RepID=UPI0032DACC29